MWVRYRRSAALAWSRPPLLRLGLPVRLTGAVALVLVALRLTVDLRLFLGEHYYFVLFAAVVLAALAGGRGPGLLATAIAIIGFNVWVLGPSRAFRIGAHDLLLTAIFGAVALLVAWIGGALQEARARSEQSLALLHAVLREMQHGVVAVEAASGEILIASDQAKALLGRATAALGDTPHVASGLIHADGSRYGLDEEPLRRVAKDGTALPAKEHLYRQPDGRVRTLELSAAPIHDAAGRVAAGVLVFSDVTDRVNAEKRTRFLADASGVLAASFSDKDALARIARLLVTRFADACRIDVVDAVGRAEIVALEATGPELVQRLQRLAVRFRRAGEAAPAAQYVVRDDARIGFPLVHDSVRADLTSDEIHADFLNVLQVTTAMVVPLVARGQIIGSVLWLASGVERRFSSEDFEFGQELARRAADAIDNARLYDEARAAVEARDEFLSMASHDLRNPMTALQLRVQTLVREANRDTAATTTLASVYPRLVDVEKQIARVVGMLDRLLDISRLQAGRMSLEPQRIDLASLVRETVRRQEPTLTKAGCAVKLEADAPVLGTWDSMRLEEVVANLLTNAAKYGCGKPVEVTVAETAHGAQFTVRDHGVGISAEDQGRLFHLFRRVGDKSAFTGSGVGLWVSQRVVEAHRGNIAIDSRPGEGTTFVVTLPMDPDSEVPVKAATTQDQFLAT